MYLKPLQSPQTKDRMGQLKTTFDLKTPPEISTAFYFDLILNALISVKYVIKMYLDFQKNLYLIFC